MYIRCTVANRIDDKSVYQFDNIIIVFGVTALMGGLLGINPIWKYGPYDPTKVTAGSQPDWYMGWPDGALRIMPGW